MPTHKGAFRIFRVVGIDVFLHWSWFVVALIEIQMRGDRYPSFVWNLIEYLSLFAIVTLHEFGHALACRSVGGRADQIVLWPLGGVAYVNPPPRPGAVLWSLVAGPLVNLALLPVFVGLWWFGRESGWRETSPHVYELVRSLLFIDGTMLVFNLLPIYPLDGGQVLRALLWYGIGPVKSLFAVTVIGFLGAAALLVAAAAIGSGWTAFVALWLLLNCWGGWRRAKAMDAMAKAPERPSFACPACKASPRAGLFWMCNRCRKPFDAFETRAACPGCLTNFPVTACTACGRLSPFEAWVVPTPSAVVEATLVSPPPPAP